MSSYWRHTENFTWKAAGSEIRNRSAARLASCLGVPGFSQPVFADQWLAGSLPTLPPHPRPFSNLFILPPGRVFLRGFFFFFFDSQDPVYLLTSNYSCAELLKNEMSSNKQTDCPLTCRLYGYFACSQLFVNNSSSGCSQNISDVSGYVISLAFFICCRMTHSNLADELCEIESSWQLPVRRRCLGISSWSEAAPHGSCVVMLS